MCLQSKTEMAKKNSNTNAGQSDQMAHISLQAKETGSCFFATHWDKSFIMVLAENEDRRLQLSVALADFNKVILLFSWNGEIFKVWEAQGWESISDL